MILKISSIIFFIFAILSMLSVGIFLYLDWTKEVLWILAPSFASFFAGLITLQESKDRKIELEILEKSEY